VGFWLQLSHNLVVAFQHDNQQFEEVIVSQTQIHHVHRTPCGDGGNKVMAAASTPHPVGG
jgi:hypothetical protein